MQVTGIRQRDAWLERVPPPVEQVRPGLWSIPVPIPDSPLRYVLVYAFELPDGVALVDAGWDCDEAWDALVAGLRVAGYELADVRAVIVTHGHPDHAGLARRVRLASGAWIAMHPADAALLRRFSRDEAAAQLSAHRAQLRRAGAPEDMLPTRSFGEGNGSDGTAFADVLVDDGHRFDLPGWDLRAVWTPGHTPGHVCLVEREHRLLLSGDHILPRISPNISLLPGQLPDPLGSYLASLRKVAGLGADEVLPAHEYRFRGLAERVGVLLSHHAERLAEAEGVVRGAPGSTSWQVAERLSWSRPLSSSAVHLRRFALWESLAHLVMLTAEGRLRSSGEFVARWYPVSVPDPAGAAPAGGPA